MSLPRPYYEEPGITVYHGDCLDILPHLEPVDALISDPPYGMKWDVDTTRFSGGAETSRSRRGYGNSDATTVLNDDQPFDPAPFLGFPRVILFGSNHFAQRLPVGTTLVWVKRLDPAFGSFLSDAEVAWQSGGHGVYCFRDLSMKSEERERAHPTQKPLPLMKWCIQRAGKIEDVRTILDPFMGSGTTLRAAKDLGRNCIGIELEEKYCEIAVNRLRQEVLL